MKCLKANVKKKRSRRPPSNVIEFPLINARLGKKLLYTCQGCYGQVFALREDGVIVCRSCNTKQKRITFRFI